MPLLYFQYKMSSTRDLVIKERTPPPLKTSDQNCCIEPLIMMVPLFLISIIVGRCKLAPGEVIEVCNN